MFFVVLIVFVKSCLQIQKTKNPDPMAIPSEYMSYNTLISNKILNVVWCYMHN